MYNIRACNQNGRTLRLTWFVTQGTRPELRSRWSIQDSPDFVDDVCRSPREDGDQSLTKRWETETIAACA